MYLNYYFLKLFEKNPSAINPEVEPRDSRAQVRCLAINLSGSVDAVVVAAAITRVVRGTGAAKVGRKLS